VDSSTQRLHQYWDAGIRGPDFVWAATGPALEAYSQYPVVKKRDEHGQVMPVAEFLQTVRRLVVDFVVGRVLSRNGDPAAGLGLDDVTTYYLLHRHDFGLNDAPAAPRAGRPPGRPAHGAARPPAVAFAATHPPRKARRTASLVARVAARPSPTTTPTWRR